MRGDKISRRVRRAAQKPLDEAVKRALGSAPEAVKPALQPAPEAVKPALQPAPEAVKPALEPPPKAVKPAFESPPEAVKRALESSPEATDEASPREYFLALSEYQRRRTAPLDAPELAAHELRVSSQNGEDGAIQEILRRTGASARPYFVGLGAGAGSEGATVLLADVLGWNGLLIEANEVAFEALARKYRHRSVQTRHDFVTPGNIEAIFKDAQVPKAPDVLSIDLDGGGYWVWQALGAYRPTLVVIEYNSQLPSTGGLVPPPAPGASDPTKAFGASIEALTELGAGRRYRLIHTDLSGINAFFVRDQFRVEWKPPRIAGSNAAFPRR
jgi:hypothetical protein